MEISKNKLLECVSQAQFAMLECAVFLDTHPCDKDALEKYEFYRKKYEMLVQQYEDQFGPLMISSDFGNNCFEWVNGPWPWEKEAN